MLHCGVCCKSSSASTSLLPLHPPQKTAGRRERDCVCSQRVHRPADQDADAAGAAGGRAHICGCRASAGTEQVVKNGGRPSLALCYSLLHCFFHLVHCLPTFQPTQLCFSALARPVALAMMRHTFSRARRKEGGRAVVQTPLSALRSHVAPPAPLSCLRFLLLPGLSSSHSCHPRQHNHGEPPRAAAAKGRPAAGSAAGQTLAPRGIPRGSRLRGGLACTPGPRWAAAEHSPSAPPLAAAGCRLHSSDLTRCRPSSRERRTAPRRRRR